jgi:hypothetical protein
MKHPIKQYVFICEAVRGVCVGVSETDVDMIAHQILDKAVKHDVRLEHMDNLASAFYTMMYDNHVILTLKMVSGMFGVDLEQLKRKVSSYGWRTGKVLPDKVARRACQKLGMTDMNETECIKVWQCSVAVTEFVNGRDRFRWNYINKLGALVEVVCHHIRGMSLSHPNSAQLYRIVSEEGCLAVN